MKNKLFRLSLAIFISALLPLTVVAQEERVTLSLENADIRDLVRWASDVTDKSIIIHPNIKGKVSVLAGDPMSKEQAYEVFLSVLQVHGFAVIESANSVKIIPDNLAKQSSVPLVDTQSNVSAEEVVVRIVKVKNIASSQLVNLLRPLVPQVGHLAAYAPTNSLILADRASNIAKILEIVKRLDQVGVVDVELIALEFATAKDVLNVISKLMPKASGKGSNEAQLFNIAADDRTNSVLMSGDPVIRQQVRNLIQRLDQPLLGDGNTQVIYLNYTNAQDIVPILKDLSGDMTKDAKGSDQIKVSIQSHESLNAIVITAPSSLLKTMRGIVAKLDVRRAQVLVEALIVEVNEDLVKNLGIHMRSNLDVVSNESVFAGFNGFPSDLDPLVVDPAGAAATLGSGLSLGYLRGGDLRMIINALFGEANANILSTPTILALDNEEAEILVGENVPFITGSEQRNGNTNPFQTIERQDIGVTLKVKPRINNDNSVTLDIEQTVESVSQTSLAAADIVTNKRKIKTRVLIENNETLVLGGLIRDEVSTQKTKVPVLGSIPVLGALFRSNKTLTVKKNLMVFLHPVILHNTDENYKVTHDRYQLMQEGQKSFRDKFESYFVAPQLPILPELAEQTKVAPKPAAAVER